uniref:GABA type A receptor associated protein like 2 n=1 Tax=Sus scrofa TaxID=9823 RepID=A0A5G2QTL2_PIG
MKWMFKEDHSLEHRCVESAKIRAKYPDRVPVIVEKVSGSQIVDIDKRKYLVPSDITVAQFMWIIRKRIQLPSEKAIFLFVDKTVPQSSMQKFQGQGLNLCHGCDLRHRNDNIGSLTCCTTKEFLLWREMSAPLKVSTSAFIFLLGSCFLVSITFCCSGTSFNSSSDTPRHHHRREVAAENLTLSQAI